MRRNRILLAAATVTAFSFLVSGCAGSPDPEPTEEAEVIVESDNQLVLYSGRNENLVGPHVEQHPPLGKLVVDIGGIDGRSGLQDDS